LKATLRLPAQRALPRSDPFDVVARVRCSKPCDAFLTTDHTGSQMRRVAAGRTVRLRLRVSDLRPRSTRRLKVELAVADRAGHVRRLKRTYRVNNGHGRG